MSEATTADTEEESKYNYQQLRIPRYLRSALKEYRDTHEDVNTLSDAILAVLPKDVESNYMEIPEDDFVLISVNEDAHASVHELAGENVTSYTVIEKFFRELAREEELEETLKKLDDRAEN